METTRHIMVLIVATALAAGIVQAAEQPQAKLSETRSASCLVKVTCDPVVLPLSSRTIEYLLRGSAVGGKAARDVLGASYKPGLFMVGPIHDPTSDTSAKPSTSSSSALAAEEQTYLFSLNVQLQSLEEKPAAKEFMDALITNLRNAMTHAFDEHALRLKGQLQLAEEEVARAEGALRQKQDQLREISGSNILDRDSIVGEMNNLRKEIQQIDMKYISDQVTIEATTKRIAELQDQIQAEMGKDKIMDELKRLLDLQEHNLGNVEKLADGGRASTTDLADAQEKMTRTRIELAQRQEQLNKSKGGDQIGSLNSTLADLSMGIAQSKTMLTGYQRQLTLAEAQLNKADNYELLSLKADVAKQNFQETLLWRDRMARQVRLIQPPDVSVIGGE